MKNKKIEYYRKPNLILARYYNKAQLYASLHNEKNYSTSLHLLCLIHAFETTRRLTGCPITYYGIMNSFFLKMSSNINSFHKHDTKIRNVCLILICGGIMS